MLLSPSHALAHAILIGSNPANGSLLQTAPAAVYLEFSEPVQPIGDGIIVISPSGRRVDVGPPRRIGSQIGVTVHAGERGSYLVIWQVISVDTHPSRGRLVFSVGRVSPVVDTVGSTSLGLELQVLSRWLHYVGYALGFGPIAFLLLVLRPLQTRGGRAAEAPVWRLVSGGILALLVSEPLSLLGQTASLGAVFDPNLAADVLASSFGRVAAQRSAAVLLLWALLGSMREGGEGMLLIGLAFGLGLSVADGEASHAISSSPAWLGLGTNSIHMAGMGVWIGGLAALLVVWRLPNIAAIRPALVARFGRLAAGALLLLGLSGVVLALQHVRAPDSLLYTGYGRALLAKQCALVAVLFVVIVGLRVPLLSRRRWWLAEGLALLAVLGFAGVLVSLPPPA